MVYSCKSYLLLGLAWLLLCGCSTKTTTTGDAGDSANVSADLVDTAGGSDLEPTPDISLADTTPVADTNVPPDTDDPADSAAENDTAIDSVDLTPPDPPTSLTPCQVGKCWSSLSFSGACGTQTLEEDFSSGLYNVHEFALFARGGVDVDLTLTRTAGTWNPVLILHDDKGVTLYDGEVGLLDERISIGLVSSGRSGDLAHVRIKAKQDMQLAVFLSGWHVTDSDFVQAMPQDVEYTFKVVNDCVAPIGKLLSPPNFDETDLDGGYFLLPPSDPSGLYVRKPDDCSRGTKLLVDVIYTVAYHWSGLYPEYSPIAIRDMNEGSCSGVDHQTHDDGTHVDIVVTCATQIACDDIQPAIALAKLFIDTGQVCGIIFNDDAVQDVINPYFESQYSYKPWHGTFMRTVSGHTGHFHVRVKKPNGSCN